MSDEVRTGRCLCGDVSYRVSGPLSGATACHCSQCRRQSGHVWAAADAPLDRVLIEGPVAWYAASPAAERGFCPRCGSFLFWKAPGTGLIEISLGSLDMPTGVRLERHIFCADKGDYYDIADGLPQSP